VRLLPLTAGVGCCVIVFVVLNVPALFWLPHCCLLAHHYSFVWSRCRPSCWGREMIFSHRLWGSGPSASKLHLAICHAAVCSKRQRSARVAARTLPGGHPSAEQPAGPAQNAMIATTRCAPMLGKQAEHFRSRMSCALRHWSPLTNASGAITCQVFPKAVLRDPGQWPGPLFDCLFPPRSKARARCGLPGTAAKSVSAVMSRSAWRAKPLSGPSGNKMLSESSGQGRCWPHSPIIHLVRQRFGGDWKPQSWAHPRGRCFKTWAR